MPTTCLSPAAPGGWDASGPEGSGSLQRAGAASGGCFTVPYRQECSEKDYYLRITVARRNKLLIKNKID